MGCRDGRMLASALSLRLSRPTPGGKWAGFLPCYCLKCLTGQRSSGYQSCHIISSYLRMKPTDFRTMINTQNDAKLIAQCLHDASPPYVFEPNPSAWDKFCGSIASEIGVASADIRIVGSGRFGFSMKPWMNLRGFSDRSDVDVVIVNPDTFDHLWLSLLGAVYPRKPVAGKLGGWLKELRNEVYTGWITPKGIRLDLQVFGEKARPVLEFRTMWFNALKRAAQHCPMRHEDVEGRLYRTWRHAELYHLHSLAALRESLTA